MVALVVIVEFEIEAVESTIRGTRTVPAATAALGVRVVREVLGPARGDVRRKDRVRELPAIGGAGGTGLEPVDPFARLARVVRDLVDVLEA